MSLRLKRVGGVASLLSAVLALWAFWLEPASLTHEQYEIALPRWPSACDGFSVVVLADLHVGSPFNGLDRISEIGAVVEDLDPDLILLAGDFVISGVIGGRPVAPEPIAHSLAALKAIAGVYAVMGNHDWRHGYERSVEAFSAAGIPVLDDASEPIQMGACRFHLAGISDYWRGPHDVERALSEAPAGSAVLAFTHNPDIFDDIPARVLLTFAGHTHGGQVNLPLFGRPIVPSIFGDRFARGHIEEGGRHLFVSPGIGTSILPVRFRVPPEVSSVTLRSAQ